MVFGDWPWQGGEGRARADTTTLHYWMLFVPGDSHRRGRAQRSGHRSAADHESVTGTGSDVFGLRVGRPWHRGWLGYFCSFLGGISFVFFGACLLPLDGSVQLFAR